MSGTEFPLGLDVLEKYMDLEQRDQIQAEYVWIGGTSNDLRSKTRTIDLAEVRSLEQIPAWSFDGKMTAQAPGKESDVTLKPVKFYPDPFRKGNNILVLCECCLPDRRKTALPTNTRRPAVKLFAQFEEEECWFGIEQEFTMLQPDKRTPLGFPKNGFPAKEGPYYCGVGTENAFGRRVMEAHYRACMHAGLKIAGSNLEVMPGQCEYQIGPCEGIDTADSLVMSRFLLVRVAEDFGICISFDPKPVPGKWHGCGCHTNFSTKKMREDGGFEHILTAIAKLGRRHHEHIGCYGLGNERRLTGKHETGPISKFSYGIAHRGASVRIPREAKMQGKGYFEDRRPASNMDPYIVTAKIVMTVCLE